MQFRYDSQEESQEARVKNNCRRENDLFFQFISEAHIGETVRNIQNKVE